MTSSTSIGTIKAQTFTASGNHPVDYISLRLRYVGGNGLVSVEFAEVNVATGYPSATLATTELNNFA